MGPYFDAMFCRCRRVDPASDMLDVCGDLLAYCPEWRRRYPEVVEDQPLLPGITIAAEAVAAAEPGPL